MPSSSSERPCCGSSPRTTSGRATRSPCLRKKSQSMLKRDRRLAEVALAGWLRATRKRKVDDRPFPRAPARRGRARAGRLGVDVPDSERRGIAGGETRARGGTEGTESLVQAGETRGRARERRGSSAESGSLTTSLVDTSTESGGRLVEGDLLGGALDIVAEERAVRAVRLCDLGRSSPRVSSCPRTASHTVEGEQNHPF